MDDQTKLALFDQLVVYLIQSSSALDQTARALAPDTLRAALVELLNGSLDSAKVLMTKVLI